MKRLAPAVLVIVILAVAVFFFVRQDGPHRPRAAEIAPAETLLFAQLPDLRRSVRRFPQTAFAHLLLEPEVQTFLDVAREKVPFFGGSREQLVRLVRAAPREAFVAVTAFDGAAPKYVAGIAFSGSRRQAEALLAEPRAAMQRAWPAGRAGVVDYGGARIDTYGEPAQVVAEVFLPGWYLVANDLEALQATIERCSGKAAGGLASTEIFRQSIAALPPALDGVAFARSGLVQAPLGNLLGALSPPAAAPDAGAPATLAWGLQFDGALMRDTIFCAGLGTVAAPLPSATMALSGPDTLLYAAMALPPAQSEFPAGVSTLLALLSPTLSTLGVELARKQITWEEFAAAFGPEVSALLAWPAAEDGPATSFALTVRDPAKARNFVAALTTPAPGAPPWQREEKDGVIFYEAPMQPPGVAAPGIALSEEFAVVGADAADVRSSVARLRAGGVAIDRREDFQALAAQVREPTTACAYVDLQRLFARSYATLRPFVAMSLAFSPSASQYFDASKLPATETIARHLGPMVYSQSVTEKGTLIESVGALSFSQTLGGVLAAAWSSAVPMLTGSAPARATPPAAAPPSKPPADFSQEPAPSVRQR